MPHGRVQQGPTRLREELSRHAHGQPLRAKRRRLIAKRVHMRRDLTLTHIDAIISAKDSGEVKHPVGTIKAHDAFGRARRPALLAHGGRVRRGQSDHR